MSEKRPTVRPSDLTDTIGGVTNGPIVDVDHIRLANGDQLLLCTNGLTDMVTDDRHATALVRKVREFSRDCRLSRTAVDLERWRSC